MKTQLGPSDFTLIHYNLKYNDHLPDLNPKNVFTLNFNDLRYVGCLSP